MTDSSYNSLLEEYEVGDEIEVPVRETPMEVVEKTQESDGCYILKMTNHHGDYELREYPTGEASLWTSTKFVSVVDLNRVG